MKSMKVMAAFNDGSAYQEGKYKSTAEHPLAFSWSRNSQNTSVDAQEVKTLFEANYGKIISDSTKAREYITTNPLVDEDGTIYVSTRRVETAQFIIYAINEDGSVKWTRETPRQVLGMVIYTNGNLIYNDKDLNMIDAQTGKDVWEKPLYIVSNYDYLRKARFRGAPVIDKDGNIIAAHSNGLYAFKGNGTQIDYMPNNISDSTIVNGVHIRNDGVIFLPLGTLYSYTFENNTFAKKYETSTGFNSKMTLTKNNELVLSTSKKIVNPETKEEKLLTTDSGLIAEVSPTVSSKDGSIYLPLTGKENKNQLNKYDRNGELVWSYNTSRRIVSPPVIDGSGNILFIQDKGETEYYITSLKPNKSPNWSMLLPQKYFRENNEIETDNDLNKVFPIVLKDGSVLVRTESKIVKVEGDQSKSDDEDTAAPEPTEESKTSLVTVFNESDKYDEPSFESQAAYTVYEYTEKKDDWYKVITAPGHTKWINASSVLEGEFEPKDTSITLMRDSIGYSSPFFYAKKTGDVLKKDKEVQVNGHIGDWYLTKVDGHDVWFNQDESKLTTFVYNKIYTEPDFSKPSPNGGVGAQTLNVKDLIVKDNGEVWYKIQSWVGDVYTPALEGDLEAIKEVNLIINADKLNAFETPFKETSSKTYNEEKVTLIAKWQNWYKTSDNLWVKFN